MADVADKPIEKVSKKDETVAEGAESVNKSENGTENKEAVVELSENAADNAEAKKPKSISKAGEPVSELESNIIRQVEYYFGDVNLSRDKFLMEQINSTSDHWVPLSVLVTFKRLAALSTDIDVIANALQKSNEGLVEISPDGTKIRRHPEQPIQHLDEEKRKEMMTRTAYAKGFPLDAKIDELLEFFAPYEKVVSVMMRKYYNKNDEEFLFKGSVFAVFEKKEQAQNFIEKDDITYKGRSLIRKWQDDYLTEKREERTRDKQERERTRKEKEESEKSKKEAKNIVLPKNSVLHFEGVEGDIKREVIREAIDKIDPDVKVAYIEYNQGDKEGHIRFHDEGSAEKYLEKLEDKKLKINDDIKLTLRKLAEEEEIEFLAKVVEDMLKRRNNPIKKKIDKGGSRKRRFGGFHNKGKKQRMGDD